MRGDGGILFTSVTKYGAGEGSVGAKLLAPGGEVQPFPDRLRISRSIDFLRFVRDLVPF